MKPPNCTGVSLETGGGVTGVVWVETPEGVESFVDGGSGRVSGLDPQWELNRENRVCGVCQVIVWGVCQVIVWGDRGGGRRDLAGDEGGTSPAVVEDRPGG